MTSNDMVLITRRFEWDMGHRIPRHGGKCKNFHGHRYVADVSLYDQVNQDESSASFGMVVDFGKIKAEIGEFIDNEWDHVMMLWEDDEAAIYVAQTGTRIVLTPFVPTVENIAKELLRVCKEIFGEHIVAKVTIWETPNCRAEAM